MLYSDWVNKRNKQNRSWNKQQGGDYTVNLIQLHKDATKTHNRYLEKTTSTNTASRRMNIKTAKQEQEQTRKEKEKDKNHSEWTQKHNRAE